MAKQDLGFVGVGNMGGPMAARLIQAGYPLTICDQNDAVVAPLIKLGATRAETAAQVAAAADIVLVSLPTPTVVYAVALGPKGVAEGGRAKIFVDLSTTGAIMAKRVEAELGAKGIRAVDCPVSGGMAGAEKGTLAVMASCPEDVFATVKPILDVLGKVFYVGPKPGSAQTLKLLNNLLSACALAISSEALVMGVKAGLDPQQFIDVVNAGTGRNSATQDKIPRFVLPRTFNFGFPLSGSNKDIRLCLEEADALGVPMVVGNAVRQLMLLAMANEGPKADMTEVVKTVEKWAGVRVGDKPAV